MQQENNTPETEPKEPIQGEVVIDHDGSGDRELTIGGLAIREKGYGTVIAKALTDILKIFRESSIGMTFPEDWILFKRPDEAGGGITGYLSDAGCKRLKPLWGISITAEGGAKNFHVQKDDVGDEYLITVRGDGYCKRTEDTIQGVEGCRGSDEDFVRNQTGTRKLAYVKKAAFRNLEGNIVRKLTGLDAMPLSELQRIWGPLGRNWETASRGRGFGGSATRYGDAKAGGAASATGPSCPVCGGEMKFIKKEATADDSRSWAFWGCKKGKGKCPGTMKDADWQAELSKRPAPEPPPEDIDGPAHPTGENYVSPSENIGEDKNRLLNRIKGTAWEKEFKTMIMKATDADSLLDIMGLINDREKGGRRG